MLGCGLNILRGQGRISNGRGRDGVDGDKISRDEAVELDGNGGIGFLDDGCADVGGSGVGNRGCMQQVRGRGRRLIKDCSFFGRSIRHCWRG